VLEEDDSLAAEAAGEEDEDAAGGEGGAGAGGVDGFADLGGRVSGCSFDAEFEWVWDWCCSFRGQALISEQHNGSIAR